MVSESKVVTLIVANGTVGKASNYVIATINENTTPVEDPVNTYTCGGRVEKKPLSVELQTTKDYDGTATAEIALKVFYPSAGENTSRK